MAATSRNLDRCNRVSRRSRRGWRRSLTGNLLLDVRYIGNKGTRLPRMIEANPAVYGPAQPPTMPISAVSTPDATVRAISHPSA
jgi:hypothetical protein